MREGRTRRRLFKTLEPLPAEGAPFPPLVPSLSTGRLYWQPNKPRCSGALGFVTFLWLCRGERGMLPGAAELGSSEFREALQAMIPQLQVGRRILSGAAAVPETPNGSNHQGGDSFLPSQSAEAAERGRRSLQQPLARPTGLLHPASILQQQRQVAVAFPLAQEGVDWAPQRPSDQSDQQRPQTRDPHVILSNSGCQLEKETAVVDVAGAAAKERRKIRAEMRQALAKGLSEFPTPLTKGGQTADPCSNEKVWISWEDARSLLIMRQLLSSGQHQEFHRNRQVVASPLPAASFTPPIFHLPYLIRPPPPPPP